MFDARLAPYGALLLRLGVGVLYLAHGPYSKFMVFGFDRFITALSRTYPVWLLYALVTVETLAGICLVLGIKVRYAALAALPFMLGVVYHHSGNGWSFARQGGGWEFPAFWALCLVVIMLIGPGRHALWDDED